MRHRHLTSFLLVFAVACSGGETEGDATAEAAEATQEYAADTDSDSGSDADAIAALAAVADYWQTHYNMGHGSMVASRYVDDGLLWNGAGAMLYGTEAIAAGLQVGIDATGSQIQLDQEEALVFGDMAITRGSFTMTGTLDGSEVTNTGYYMSLAENVDGEWKLHGGVSNFDSPDQTITPGEQMEMPEGEGAELLQARLDYYVTHFNMGHASMVADTYTEDAVSMGSGDALRTGRAAAQERLQGMMDDGAQIKGVSVWSAQELDDGHVSGIGTFTLEGPDGDVEGHFAALYERGDDGTLMLKWLLTSNHPAAM